MKNVIGFSSFLLILNFIVGLKDNKLMLKVFLSYEDIKVKVFFKNIFGIFEDIDFVVVFSKFKKELWVEKGNENSLYCIDKNM